MAQSQSSARSVYNALPRKIKEKMFLIPFFELAQHFAETFGKK